ncbi:Hypothetical protein PHPALM_15049 [Phytophthora palmivora]|uniref:PiggyBac transposable element-derived protein domain-containing protein n=1 Tax=Phytophthora palmivora TaxID=4796 RepID=A0A2P4XTD6_9STRA|nr:Hypothetical protein PHPALM_15049 [Phytophthora palmivora]
MNDDDVDMELLGLTEQYLRDMEANGWETYDEDKSGNFQVDQATDYYNGSCGPTRSAVAYADSPLGMFFYFLPKELWVRIADESNRYREQNITAVATSRRKKLLVRQAKDPRISVPNLEEIEENLAKFKRIQDHEIVHVIALFFARAIAPIRDGLSKHWCVDEEGAIPRGTFSRFMKRGRFEDIMTYLHFNSNPDVGAHADKAWKICPVLQVVERTFRRGYRLGKVISFDEGMMPNRSKFNPMRIFMPDKPSKNGTKFYMTCCAKTAYCSRNTLGLDPKAVIRNISKALSNQDRKRLIVTDSYYSTVSLSLKLLETGLYHVGTTRTDRLSWSPFHFTQQKRPRRMRRGTYRIAQARDHPGLVALSWMDSKPVNMLATGCSTMSTSMLRTEKGGTRSTVPCPQLVVDYGLGMGGLDVHDQLRLQRYSIQKCISLHKYYKQLFLCIVDMAVVNGYTIHPDTLKKKGEKLPTHAEYLRRLHAQLLALRTINFETYMNSEDLVSGPVSRPQHTLGNTTDLRDQLLLSAVLGNIWGTCAALSSCPTS